MHICSKKGVQGLSRLAIIISYLHKNSNFIELILETVEKSLHAFMQVGNYPTRDFATLEPSVLQLPFAEVSILSCELILLTLQRRAGVRPFTSFYNLARSCVFIKQSLLSVECHHLFIMVFHFPKLRN